MAGPLGNRNASGKRSQAFVERMKTASTGNTNHLGKPHSEETRRKISESRKGKNIGSANPMWKGGKSSEDYLERRRFRRELQSIVFARDNYTCQVCDSYGGSIQVDHIKSWSDYPELRFDINNCRTLCMSCHYYVTFRKKIPAGIIWGHNLSKRKSS